MTRNKLEALLLKALVYLAIGITVIALVFLLGYILIKGIPHLSPDLFALTVSYTHLTLPTNSLV